MGRQIISGAASFQSISVPALVASAGGDPWAADAALQAGNPAQVDALACAFYDACRCTEAASGAFDAARRRFAAAWRAGASTHPLNGSADVRRVATKLDWQFRSLSKIGVDLENIAADLAGSQRAAAAVIAALESDLHRLDDELSRALTLEVDQTLTEADRCSLDAQICCLEDDAIAHARDALDRLHDIRTRYSDRLRGSLTAFRVEGDDPDSIRDLDAPARRPEPPRLPSPGTGPDGASGWWNSLTAQDRERLVADHPSELGNLDGIPILARSIANTAVMNADLRRVEDAAARHGVTAHDVAQNPGEFGLTAGAVTRYANARRTRQGMVAASAVDERRTPPEVFLLRYQPEAFGGEGAAAIAMGNPDTAANTAVLVPGLGSNVRDGSLADLDGSRLYAESARADWNQRSSVILWIGYDAPNVWYDPGLWTPDMARTGGQALAADVNALAVTHAGPPAHVTVIGSSYGSTTVADAASTSGMHADNVVLVGCPGTDMAHSADDFHLPAGGHLFVGAASADAVTWSPGHVSGPGLHGPTVLGLGDDPAVDGYGSTRFKAEVPGFSVNPVRDHSHYFDDGSESLFSIADVVSGHGDALQRDGMTAHHRGEYGVGGWVDPEFLRTPTSGHRHGAPGGP